MTTITMDRSFDAPPEIVWEVMTDPDLYAAVAPNLTTVEIVSGDGEGMVRRCVDTDGNAWTESVHTWEEGRRYGVAVDVADSDFHRRLFERFEGTWAMEERATDVLVTIRFDYDTKYGPVGWLVSKYFQRKAPPLIERIFDGWEAAIEGRLGDARAATDGPEPTDGRDRSNALYR